MIDWKHHPYQNVLTLCILIPMRIRATNILDNLIAEESAKEMIVVMTNGNPWQAASPNEEPVNPNGEKPDVAQMGAMRFEKSLVANVIPFIEKRYRTYTDKNNRAIVGFSMGGLQTQHITNSNPNLFMLDLYYSNRIQLLVFPGGKWLLNDCNVFIDSNSIWDEKNILSLPCLQDCIVLI